jgi:hypothetical protein
MSILSRVLNGTSAALGSLLMLSMGGAMAQGSDSGRLPPPPLPVPTAAAAASPSANAAASGSVSNPSAGVAPTSSTESVPGANSAAISGAAPGAATAPASPELDVAPGAGEDKRRALLGRINEAKSQGIGTSTYMIAFDALEQSVKGGETEANVLKRVSSLNTSLDDQFKRSAILKVQRAAPPVAASAPSAPLGSAGGGTSKSSDTASLIQRLQNKYGNQIPDLQNKYGDKIPDGLKDKLSGAGGDPSALLKNPEIMDLIKKYQK